MKRNELDLSVVLGRAVRTRRHELGLSQEELAWRAGLHRTYVSDVERGSRNLSLATIDRLAQALQTPITTLLGPVDQPPSSIPTIGLKTVEPAQVDILLVEDNVRDVELTLRALQRARLANFVQVVNDGAEALDYVFCTGSYAGRKAQDRPHLILLDLNLPKLDGLEVLRRLKTDESARSIPVVILTNSEESHDFADARQLGADAYIVKPVDFQRLSKVTPGLNFSWMLRQSPLLPTK